MMWYWGGGVHWWEWLLGFIGMVLFWGLIIWAVWSLVSGLSGRSPQPPPPAASDARRILDERLARGEIDVEEYRRLLDVMRSGPDGRPHAPTGG